MMCCVEKLNWNHQEEDEDELIGDEGDEEIGLSHSHEKKGGGVALQSNKSAHQSSEEADQDYDGEDESDQQSQT